MRKNQNGVTMVALVIIIIVMLIISGIIIYEGTSTIKSAKQQSINTNMLLIQAKARTIADKVDFGEGVIIGNEITDETIKTKLNIQEGQKVYELTQDQLYEMGVDVSGNNEYAVDYDNDEVYYIEGLEDKDGNIFYSLTDISNLSLTE